MPQSAAHSELSRTLCRTGPVLIFYSVFGYINVFICFSVKLVHIDNFSKDLFYYFNY